MAVSDKALATPFYGCTRANTMRSGTALCFIVWNKVDGCKHDVPKFDFTGFDEAFAIDGGSVDGTVEVLREHKVAVYPQRARSLNAAYWQAVETTTCDNIVVFFPKGTLDPSVAQTTRSLLASGKDLVVASRLIKGAHNEEDDRLLRPRKWGIEVLAVSAAMCWRRRGPMVWDVLHGVKGFKREAFLRMKPSRIGVSIDLEMVVRAYRLGAQVCEFPVFEARPDWGDTRFKVLPTGVKLAKFLYCEFRSPMPLEQAINSRRSRRSCRLSGRPMTRRKTKTAVVVTSIAPPTAAMRQLARGCLEHKQSFYLIGDVSNPTDFSLQGCEFFSLERQLDSGFQTAAKAPTRHYARKDVGYLQAIRDGATVIVETDDDNEPTNGFWDERSSKVATPIQEKGGWINVYRYFTGEMVWPRGLPLRVVRREVVPYENCGVQEVDCPIQLGLADQNPDVDAIYRLIGQLPIEFRGDRTLALAPGTWCPFNSQNTTFFNSAFALLYLPAFCSFGMTHIWRNLIAQRILWENGGYFHAPTVVQSRNDHDLMKDFSDEIPDYLKNDSIVKILSTLPLKPGDALIGSNLVACYEALIKAELFPPRELDLVDMWLQDLSDVEQLCD
jgi:STELLO glycosyltransferases